MIISKHSKRTFKRKRIRSNNTIKTIVVFLHRHRIPVLEIRVRLFSIDTYVLIFILEVGL